MPRMTETTRPETLALLPPLSRVVATFAKAVARWQDRRVSRRALSLLDPHMLRDVGLSTQDRDAETVKPFWRD